VTHILDMLRYRILVVVISPGTLYGKRHALVHSVIGRGYKRELNLPELLFLSSRCLWLQTDLQLNHACHVSDSACCNIATRYQEQ